MHGGASALQKLRLEEFDLAILDVMIPKISGLEVARRVRADGIETPILFLTAKDSLSDRVTGYLKNEGYRGFGTGIGSC